MNKIIQLFKLKNEAELLDSKFYILKAFFSILTAYIIAKNNNILQMDMISLLFGLMLTLEPVSLTGVKSGINQVYASVLGAISTSIIVFIGGNNAITVALAIAFTLYVCIKINWREVSPVAIFTSIYMTQFMQTTTEGIPSLLLTFRLRILALGTGVFIAVLFNFIFSIISYRKMMYKRVIYIMDKILSNMDKTTFGLEKKEVLYFINFKKELPATFIDIDWIISLFNDMKKEYKIILKNIGVSNKEIDKLEKLLMNLRTITHLNYDIIHVLSNAVLEEKSNAEYYEMKKEEIISLQNNLKEIKGIILNYERKTYTKKTTSTDDVNVILNEGQNYMDRLSLDIMELRKNVETVEKIIKN